jgi:thymidylate kinase
MTLAYLAVEGIDGSGKSLQVKRLSEHLRQIDLKPRVLHFTNKDQTILGELIKSLYGHPTKDPIICWLRKSHSLQAALYALNARENLRPARQFESNHVLLGDRSLVTAYVVHHELFRRRPYLRLLEPRLVPGYVLVLDLDPRIAYGRLQERSSLGVDETLDRMTEMRRRFLEFASGSAPPEFNSTEWRVIDGTLPPDEVTVNVIDWALCSLGIQAAK